MVGLGLVAKKISVVTVVTTTVTSQLSFKINVHKMYTKSESKNTSRIRTSLEGPEGE
jgi:hypothetical protein